MCSKDIMVYPLFCGCESPYTHVIFADSWVVVTQFGLLPLSIQLQVKSRCMIFNVLPQISLKQFCRNPQLTRGVYVERYATTRCKYLGKL